MKTNIYLGIPNVMLTVLGPSLSPSSVPLFFAHPIPHLLICPWTGVVIGFVISYRAMSGYVLRSTSLFYLSRLPFAYICYSVSWCGVSESIGIQPNPDEPVMISPQSQSQSHTHPPMVISPTPSTLDGVSRCTRAHILVPVLCLCATSVTPLKTQWLDWFGLVRHERLFSARVEMCATPTPTPLLYPSRSISIPETLNDSGIRAILSVARAPCGGDVLLGNAVVGWLVGSARHKRLFCIESFGGWIRVSEPPYSSRKPLPLHLDNRDINDSEPASLSYRLLPLSCPVATSVHCSI